MRKMVLSLMSAAALVLTGCNAPSSPQQAGSAAPASASTAAAVQIANEVSGTVSVRGPEQPSSKASLVINLVDVSSTANAGAPPLATEMVTPVGPFPQSFKLTLDPIKVKPNDMYVVQAVLTDGERHYTMPIQAPVLTNGNKNVVSIELVAQQTAGEKALAGFTAEEKQLGAMKVSHGTKLEKDASRGWQLFRQDGKVKFIRELVDYTDKTFTSTDYAYKDGKPWVIVQQIRANRDAKPSAIDRAGWSDNGILILKQHQVGNDVQVLDADAAAKLQAQGLEILSLATNGKNK
ncbi:MAG: YbaY family lipoprotein [Pseudomonadota bacterium]|nr:YbaY family lipoprotein [Pseudomonadota bacterium]